MAKKINDRKELELNDVDRKILSEYGVTSIPIQLHTDPFSTIAFPSLPYNFAMLMGDIDWPKKAAKNPNGTLFTSPKEIDKQTAEDIGLQCFGNFKDFQLTGSRDDKKNKKVSDGKKQIKQNYENGTNESAFSFINNQENSVLQWLLSEATYDMKGIDINVSDIKSINQNYKALSTGVIPAIENYIQRSLSVISPMLQLVSGSSGSGLKKINDAVTSVNKMGINTITEWINQHDETLRKSTETELKNARIELDAMKSARYFLSCMQFSDLSGATNPKKVVAELLNRINTIENVKDLDKIVNDFTTYGTFKDFDKYASKEGGGSSSARPIKINPKELKLGWIHESFKKFKLKLKEGSRLITEDSGDDPKIEPIDYDNLNNKIFNILSDAMNDVIGRRADWACMKGLEEAMKNLKDRADAEIKKKIELICKTNGQKSLKHWPFKAEGLLSMWERYSSELQLRMKNRLDQLTGSNGGRESGTAHMLEDFLRTTYPRLIAAMTTYRMIFEQIQLFYKRNLVPEVTLDNAEEILQVTHDRIDEYIKNNLGKFDLDINI